MINGEEVLCGNSGFMHLMGIRLPQKLASKSSVFVSINGVLAGIFTIKYIPLTSVQTALANLLHTRREPIFAIRDFNVTPLIIRQKFRMPTDGFDFPTFAKRYEISAAEPSPVSHISAIITHEGLGSLVEVSERGRKLYIAIRLATILSILCTAVGIFLMFTLCLSGAFDAASAENMLTYMFLWLVPIIVIAFGLAR
jgi:cation transport ATPase